MIKRKKDIIKALATHKQDVGSTEIQIGLLTDKIVKLISEIFDRNISNTKIIIKSLSLDKKSKLRNLFEKSKNLVTIPVYEDTDNNLANVVINYLSKKKIKLSRESINLEIKVSASVGLASLLK